MFERKKVAMIAAEVLATAMLTMGILAITKSAIGIPYFVALGAGLTLDVITMLFVNVSGAHANPAITLGQWTVRALHRPLISHGTNVRNVVVSGLSGLDRIILLTAAPELTTSPATPPRSPCARSSLPTWRRPHPRLSGVRLPAGRSRRSGRCRNPAGCGSSRRNAA